ncbi:MAG: twin-arginine translocation signal domain-containing protein [Rhodospirillales bacterium]|nr:twin-arginine translocation signal domain-containing protein [Rhodospirillales bacterium]
MSDKKDIRTTSRRDLLKMAGLAAGAAGAAAAAGATKAAPVEREKDGGYRESEHVRKYYELAR